MPKTVAILATLDTKGAEAAFVRQELEALGGKALVIDLGVVGEASAPAEVTREEVAEAGGRALAELLRAPSREEAGPVMARGAAKVLAQKLDSGEIHAVLGFGGTQGTSLCCEIMQSLPYGFPKVMLSTVASGDTSPFVGIKDITMMFSVSDILGLNAFSRKMLASAAGAALGMAQVTREIGTRDAGAKPLIGMTNLGVLTRGAMHAIDRFHAKGYEVIPFHAVGSGGRAMEQMMKEGIIGAVFDYALGEIADEVFDGLRAANAKRLTVAGKLGLPQVIVPGGAEHIGLLLHTPNEVPKQYAEHKYSFHSPVVFAPRLNETEIVRVAETICERLQHSTSKTRFFMPLDGVSSYSAPGGELRDTDCDTAFWNALQENMPDAVEVHTHPGHAESDAFVDSAVDALIDLIENG